MLAAHGICYPDVGRPAPTVAHHDIANALKGPPFPLHEPEHTPRQYLRMLQEYFQSNTNILLSSEIFMRFVPAFHDKLGLDLSRLAGFKSIADQVKVIIYFRRQDEYLESFYGQEVKHKLTMDFQEFAATRLPDYAEICEQLAATFGRENLLVRAYDRSQFVGGSIFSDFLSALALDLTDQYTVPTNTVHPSITADERAFKLLLNTLDLSLPEVMQFNKPLMDLSQLKRQAGSLSDAGSTLLSAAQRANLLRECEGVNRRLAIEFMGRSGNNSSLFAAPAAVDEASHAGTYPGLSAAARAEIVSFLKNSYGELMPLLCRAIDSSAQSKDPVARESARLLKLALA